MNREFQREYVYLLGIKHGIAGETSSYVEVSAGKFFCEITDFLLPCLMTRSYNHRKLSSCYIHISTVKWWSINYRIIWNVYISHVFDIVFEMVTDIKQICIYHKSSISQIDIVFEMLYTHFNYQTGSDVINKIFQATIWEDICHPWNRDGLLIGLPHLCSKLDKHGMLTWIVWA